MASRKKLTTTPSEARLTRGRARDAASFPAAPTKANLPATYSATLAEIKQCVRQSRLRTVLAANAAMVMAYWEIGRVILDRQQAEGWGAKVIDRLSSDLRKAFPDMRGLSPRNLKYMRSFAAAWPDAAIVQGTLAQIGWYQNIALLDKLADAPTRLWYAQQAAEHGWSQPILCLQMEARVHERHGNVWNFRKFSLTFAEPGKRYAPSSELSRTQGRLIVRVEDPEAREYHIEETARQQWSSRPLARERRAPARLLLIPGQQPRS